MYIIAQETVENSERKREFYVGITTKGEARLRQHVNHEGAEWCKGKQVYPFFLELSPPIYTRGVSTDQMRRDVEQLENLVTAQMMMLLGLNRVRGGDLVDRFLYKSDHAGNLMERFLKYKFEREKQRDAVIPKNFEKDSRNCMILNLVEVGLRGNHQVCIFRNSIHFGSNVFLELNPITTDGIHGIQESRDPEIDCDSEIDDFTIRASTTTPTNLYFGKMERERNT